MYRTMFLNTKMLYIQALALYTEILSIPLKIPNTHISNIVTDAYIGLTGKYKKGNFLYNRERGKGGGGITTS